MRTPQLIMRQYNNSEDIRHLEIHLIYKITLYDGTIYDEREEDLI